MSVSSQSFEGKCGAVPGAEAFTGLKIAEFAMETELNRACLRLRGFNQETACDTTGAQWETPFGEYDPFLGVPC